MYKTAVIGDRDSILGFKAIGMDVFDINGRKPSEVLTECAKNNYAVIFVTEDILHMINDEMEKYSEASLPAIIPIPGNKGSKGLGMENIKKAAEKAIGADILFNDN
ncbi:MAG: V-type ATP synthase subunit F [Clostridia bacterium]|nr:V-type ATP synthase subunit F [Clostridia bacterium]MBN2882124.1 V-type ATP synthase subunit F [Clostridia bacterium]